MHQLLYHVSVLLLTHEPASVTELGTVTEQHDVSTAITNVSVW